MAWTEVANIQGPQGVAGPTGAAGSTGPSGARGSLWFTGSGAPGTISGQLNGDMYLNNANGAVYQLVSGTWTLQENITGPTGATGATGPTGPAGGSLSGYQSAWVLTQESTTSTTWTDLTTTTDAVTITVGASGAVLLGFYFYMHPGTASVFPAVTFAASGANTITPNPAPFSDQYLLTDVGNDKTQGRTVLLTGLSPGSTTFKMKYAANTATTVSFKNRNIWAIPL